MTILIYTLLYLLALVVPGWLLVRLTGMDQGRPVFVLAGSYITYTWLAALSKWLNLPLGGFYALYLGLLLLLALLLLRYRQTDGRPAADRRWLAGLTAVISCYGFYHLLVGPYTEVPADFLHHLNYTRQQLAGIADNHLGPERDWLSLFKQRGGIWYSLFALLTSLTGLDLDQALSVTVLLNSLVFLCAVYGFAWYLFGHYAISPTARLAASLLAAGFTATHMGLNVFSYIRYYALAPTMLNMVIYFAAVIATLELLRWQGKRILYTLFLLLSLIAAIMVHNQEGLFILVMGGMMLGWFALYPQQRNPFPVTRLQVHSQLAYRILFILLIAAFLALVVWAYLKLQRPAVFYNKIIQLSPQGPILNRILFLNPGFQGIEVITNWGLLVYALLLVYWRRFVAHPFLFAGMLVPLFTVFNPLFVDWFMRMDGVNTLWRLLYIVPIHFVGALACVFLVEDVRAASSRLRRWVAGLTTALLFILLLPLGGLNDYARQTLASVDHDDSYLYWQDLMDHLDASYPNRVSILTDPVTGYMIAGLTRHRTYHRKFFNSGLHPINLPRYGENTFEKYSGWLLVINYRDGGHSQMGEIARHWPADILQTSTFYSEPLRRFIDSNPDQFRLSWENQGIRIYEIR